MEIGEPSEAERVSMAYCTVVSPVDLNTQAISTGVWSSHMNETGVEEVNSSGVGPSRGATVDLKKSSYPAFVSSEYDDRASSVERTRPITRHQYLFRFDKSGVCWRKGIEFAERPVEKK